jgi:hypothetical protein
VDRVADFAVERSLLAANGSRAVKSLQYPVADVAGLTTGWTFKASPIRPWPFLRATIYKMAFSEAPPKFLQIKAASIRDTWVALFIYSPTGTLDSSQLFTLARLRDLNLPVCVVCACPTAQQVPFDLPDYCDALYWKAMNGYDFSAYSLALSQLGIQSPGADVLILNDSMFGPFSDFRPLLRTAPWELVGLTASAAIENHIQSYSFLLRDVTTQRLRQLAPVISDSVSFSHACSVVENQEIKLARVASRFMSAGACWYADGTSVDDPCLRRPFELMRAGFPFMKKSLLGKMSVFQNIEQSRDILRDLKHPL